MSIICIFIFLLEQRPHLEKATQSGLPLPEVDNFEDAGSHSTKGLSRFTNVIPPLCKRLDEHRFEIRIFGLVGLSNGLDIMKFY